MSIQGSAGHGALGLHKDSRANNSGGYGCVVADSVIDEKGGGTGGCDGQIGRPCLKADSLMVGRLWCSDTIVTATLRGGAFIVFKTDGGRCYRVWLQVRKERRW